jgi:hypothetical protein
MIFNILMNAFYAMHGVIGPANVIPNIDLIDSLLDHGKIDIWNIVPSLVDELGETPDVLQKFTSAKFICASGGESPSLGFSIPSLQILRTGHLCTDI